LIMSDVKKKHSTRKHGRMKKLLTKKKERPTRGWGGVKRMTDSREKGSIHFSEA